MTWAAAIPILIQYGLPFLEMLITKAQDSNATVTPADIEQLKTLAANNVQSQILAAAARAGLPSDNPLIQKLLAMWAANPS